MFIEILKNTYINEDQIISFYLKKRSFYFYYVFTMRDEKELDSIDFKDEVEAKKWLFGLGIYFKEIKKLKGGL